MLWLRAKTSVAFDRHLLSYPIACLKQRCTNKHQKCLHHFLCLYVTESLRNSLSTISSTLFCATAKPNPPRPSPDTSGVASSGIITWTFCASRALQSSAMKEEVYSLITPFLYPFVPSLAGKTKILALNTRQNARPQTYPQPRWLRLSEASLTKQATSNLHQMLCLLQLI